MSRPGITYQEVANSAVLLQGQSENPTVDRIREILGTGSKSTIARYLKDWKSKTGHITGSNDLPHELISIIKGLWHRLKTESENQVTKHQQETDRNISEIRQILVQEQKQNLDLQTKLSQSEDQLHQEKHQSLSIYSSLDDEKRCNATLSERNVRLTQQVVDQKVEIERLHRLLSHVQTNLEHYQSSVQKLCEEQQLNSEKQKTKYEQEIHLLNQNIDVLIFKKNQIQSELDKIEERSLVIIELEKKLSVFTTEISNLQKSLNGAQDKIKTLRNEKLFITQEKIALEGQLKPFEARV